MSNQYRIVERMTLLVEHYVNADSEEQACELVTALGATEYDHLIEVEANAIVSIYDLPKEQGND